MNHNVPSLAFLKTQHSASSQPQMHAAKHYFIFYLFIFCMNQNRVWHYLSPFPIQPWPPNGMSVRGIYVCGEQVGEGVGVEP